MTSALVTPKQKFQKKNKNVEYESSSYSDSMSDNQYDFSIPEITETMHTTLSTLASYELLTVDQSKFNKSFYKQVKDLENYKPPDPSIKLQGNNDGDANNSMLKAASKPHKKKQYRSSHKNTKSLVAPRRSTIVGMLQKQQLHHNSSLSVKKRDHSQPKPKKQQEHDLSSASQSLLVNINDISQFL